MKQVLLHIAICTFVAVSFCPEAIESCTMLSIAGKQLRRQAGPCQEGLALLARGLAGSAASLQEEAGQEGTIDFGELEARPRGALGGDGQACCFRGGAASTCRLPPAARHGHPLPALPRVRGRRTIGRTARRTPAW